MPDAGYRNTLGIAHFRAGVYSSAIEALQQSIELGEDSPHNWLPLAIALKANGKHDEGKLWYDKALAWKEANSAAVNADNVLQAFFERASSVFEQEPEARAYNGQKESDASQ